ncbi:hypothetical protein [Marinobacter xiaoshiensis]|uniref:Phage abortive infection protein n=1 Tax=Marinobacter xiaoshiensis TaxID=3073652 RepID=A0ABU2HKA0_9GAMM|nr:hypothetical protein [Marinobacter sp. F60267]MDS1311496.1 hypothetical protein [Marinobacter sp. F60267]
MDYTYWLDFAPSALSATAGLAAAIAAFNSLKVSRESQTIAEQSALAIHHDEASRKLADVSQAVSVQARNLHQSAKDVWTEFPREVERSDLRDAGGTDPRPLRHVLNNASEMLERYATNDGKQYSRARHGIFSVIRNGMGKLSDSEYRKLLKVADRTYGDFESIFGVPRKDASISESLAFRWAYYQLERRVGGEEWGQIWGSAWSSGGRLKRYRDEFEQLKPTLERELAVLQVERRRLQYTVFPLARNEPLYRDYLRAIGILEGLVDVIELDLFDGYIHDPHPADLIPLVISSVAAAIMTARAIDDLEESETE